MKTKIAIAAVVFTFLCAGLGQGTLQVSNLGQSSTGSGTVASDAWIAQLFRTGTNAAGYFLDSVQVLMNAPSGTPGPLAVYIYPTTLTQGGASIGQLAGGSATGAGTFTYTADSMQLMPGTQYYVVLTASTPASTGYYNWSAASAFTTSGSGWDINDIYEASADGVTWVHHAREQVFQMGIYATPVPEPGTCAVFLLGAAGVWCVRRFRG